MDKITDKSMDEFLHELASKQVTPGGGSVAAVMGANAAALISMVCNLTIGKPEYSAVELDMQTILSQSENLRKKFITMITADIEVFNKLMVSYALPKTTNAEKLSRSTRIQVALKEASLVPMKCSKACAESIALARVALEKGNKNVISDVGVATMAGYSGLKSSALNVYANVSNIKDSNFVTLVLAELEQIVQNAELEAEEIYQTVKIKL